MAWYLHNKSKHPINKICNTDLDADENGNKYVIIEADLPTTLIKINRKKLWLSL